MPSSSFTSRTYSKKSVKRKPEEEPSVQQPKRQKVVDDDGEVPTDTEDDSQNTKSMPRGKAPKDLSQIFEDVTPTSTPLASPTKLAKRMLSRSRTESSIASGSESNSFISRTSSMSAVYSPPKPLAATFSEPHAPKPQTKSTTTRTYAGASRSFLVALPLHGSSLEEAHDELEDELNTRESYTSLRTRWGVDNSEDDPYPYASPTRSQSNSASTTPNTSPLKGSKGKAKAVPPPLPDGMMNPLKSITELRNKGESRRFLDEVGYLFEGMDKDAGLGLKRASALEIITKLCDMDFTRKAKAADFLGRTWDVLREAGAGKGVDKILDILLAFFAALLSRDIGSLTDLVHHSSSSFIRTLFVVLDSLTPSTDPLTLISSRSADAASQLRKLGFSKKEQTLLSAIHTTISSKSSLFPPSTPLSTALLITRSLTSLPSELIPSDSMHVEALLTTLQSLLPPLLISPLPNIVTTFSYDDSPITFAPIYNTLILLDTYLLGGWAPSDGDDAVNKLAFEKAREDWLADTLVALCVLAEVVGLRHSVAGISEARKCRVMSLRLLVSLTHSNQRWCERLMSGNQFFLGFLLRTIARGYCIEPRKAADTRPGKDLTESDDCQSNGSTAKDRKLGKGKERPVKQEEDDADFDGDIDLKEKAADALDALCLALGILTNLAQVIDKTGEVLRKTELSRSCSLSEPACLTSCQCPHQITAIEVLVGVYTQLLLPAPLPYPVKFEVKVEVTPPPLNAPAAMEEGESSLLLAHLSLLFGLLMRSSVENQDVILNTISPVPGDDGPNAKLDRLVEQAREFVYIYSGGEAEEEGGGVRAVIGFMEGLRRP